MPRRRSTRPEVGTVILESGLTRYEYVDTLGASQHGQLHLVRMRAQDSLGGLAVAKSLHAVCMENDAYRLVEEARLLTLLDHRAIACVHHLGGSPAEPILILQHTDGWRLDAWLALAQAAGHRPSEAFCCHVVAEIAEALHHAYNGTGPKGEPLQVIHRDVTPHSIVVGRQGMVRLTDFDRAWSRLEGRPSTEGGPFVGTVAYASPEHARLEALDERSDQFSLSLVLLQLLSGRHLLGFESRFEAEVLELTQRAEVLAKRSMTELPRQPEMSVKRTQALLGEFFALTSEPVTQATQSLAEPLRSILRKGLAPKAEDRFSTSRELAEALREHLWRSGKPYDARSLSEELCALVPSPPGGASPRKAKKVSR